MDADRMPEVVQNPAQERFEAEVGGETAFLTYAMEQGRMYLLHTEVPEESEGRGVGSNLVRVALEHARTEGLSVVPSCPFVRAYLQRHPEFQDLVHPE